MSDWSSDVCSSDLGNLPRGAPRRYGAKMNDMHSIGAERLHRRMARGCDFMGCEVAILGGAMSWVSERHLVSAISNAGGFGVIACGAMTPDLLDAEIAGTDRKSTRQNSSHYSAARM